jgi:hypothetical protein
MRSDARLRPALKDRKKPNPLFSSESLAALRTAGDTGNFVDRKECDQSILLQRKLPPQCVKPVR